MAKAAKQRPPRKTGGPRHCRRCPGKPLLAECMHTLIGKAYLAAVSATVTRVVDVFI
jgi:hypothetical protein